MNLLVIFGSRTTEHDVSIISGLTVYEELKKNPSYNVHTLYINKKGGWELDGTTNDIAAHRKKTAEGKKASVIFKGNNKLNLHTKGFFGKLYEFDLVMPIMHGMNGEDGTLQGVLEMAGVPYTGSSVLGSALGMDKIAMKDVLTTHLLPQVAYTSFYRNDWQIMQEKVLNKVTSTLKFPIFVKPANLGSSIGISRATNMEKLINAIDVAVYYDERIICEEGISTLQEINCAVRGNNQEQEASLLEEPVSYEEFLTFEEKYINSGGTMQGVKSKVKIPAVLPKESMTQEIQDAAKKVFKVLNCSGIARIDFLVNTETQEFFVNEINSIPGSLQNHLWKASGVSFAKLLDDYIEDALNRSREKQKSSFAFQSDILNSGEMKK